MLAEGEPTDAKGRTRARILRAAVRLFQKHGYRRTSVDEVVRAAGVGKGTVYLHFENKSELLLQALIEEKKQFIRPFLPLLEEEMAPEERLRRALAMNLKTICQMPLTRRLLSGDQEMHLFFEDVDPAWRERYRADEEAAARALLDGVGSWNRLSPKERTKRTQLYMGLVFSLGALMDDRVRHGLSEDEYAEQLARTVVHGICSP